MAKKDVMEFLDTQGTAMTGREALDTLQRRYKMDKEAAEKLYWSWRDEYVRSLYNLDRNNTGKAGKYE